MFSWFFFFQLLYLTYLLFNFVNFAIVRLKILKMILLTIFGLPSNKFCKEKSLKICFSELINYTLSNSINDF